MADDRKWTVARTPARRTPPAGAARQRPRGITLPRPVRAERVRMLRERVRRGHYASDAMMDLVALRLLERGDL